MTPAQTRTGRVVVAAQLNAVAGDVPGNIKRIREVYLRAEAEGAKLVVCPELSVTGCPLEDLANQPDLIHAADLAVSALASATKGRKAALVVGAPRRRDGAIHNTAVALVDGAIAATAGKRMMPSYNPFDEQRTFIPDLRPPQVFAVDGFRVGLMVGEDSWTPDAARHLAGGGAEILVCACASPYRPGVMRWRVKETAAERVAETRLPILYVNAVGGQDEVVLDGGSFLMDGEGRLALQLPRWEESVMSADLLSPTRHVESNAPTEPMEDLWYALTLAVGDYARKSGFTDVVLGLSGGLDSALVAAVAGDALGAGHVHCIRLPSQHTSDLSNDLAAEMCRIWGFPLETLPIGPVVTAAADALAPWAGPAGLKRLTLENMQARARGYLLMTVSNERGWLLLSTGNKSEAAVGYATLYGDMCGGFCPLKDVYKTTAYALARWRNRHHHANLRGPAGTVIPEGVIDRPPTAELAPGQRDTDSLPPYEVLDAMLGAMVENEAPREEILAMNFDPAQTARVYTMVARGEFKRRQGAPGPKTTSRAFSRERRMPIINHFDPSCLETLRGLAGEWGE